MLTRAAKDEQIKEFNAAFKQSPSVVVVEYKGLSVSEMEKLRQDIRGAQAELRVVKNTLLKIAAKDTDIEQIDELFEGPTAVAICESDPSAVAKVFVNTIKDAPHLKLKGGFVDGSVLDANALSELSKLPSRPEMLAKILGLLQAPMSNVVGALTQMQTKLLYALVAVKEGKENEPEAAPEPEKAEETPAEAKETPAEEEKQAPAEAEAKPEEAEAKEAPSEEAKAEEPKEAAEAPAEAEAKEEATSEEAEAPVEDTKEEAAAEEAPETQEASEAEEQEAPSEEAAEQAEEAEEKTEEDK